MRPLHRAGPAAAATAFTALAAALLSGCGPSAAELARVDYTPTPTGDWPVSTPAAEGVDSALLARLYAEAGRLEKIRSVLVVANGRLIAEDYFNDGAADTPGNVQSVTKSVTSALVGLALEDGCLAALDRPMLDYFPVLADSIRDPRKADITVEHLLAMRAGYPWEESRREWFDTLYAGFRTRHLVSFPLVRDPGTAMEYSNLSTHLLGIVLARACETDLPTFARERLFEPLGIEPGGWMPGWEDYFLAFGGLELRARDMARFGQLYLDGGEFRGRPVVPPAWVEASLRIRSEDAWHIGIGDHVRDLAYGYQWWTVRTGPGPGAPEYRMAWGHGGQQIVLLEDRRMVIVVTADPLLGEHGGGPWRHEKAHLNLVGDFVAALHAGTW